MWKKLFGSRNDSPETAAAPEPLTLKSRVDAFWKWYAGAAERLTGFIEQKQPDRLTAEVEENANRFLPDIAWVFGPGADGVGHSFTLSAEGNAFKRLVARFWLEAAPRLNGWTFYGARQASPTFADHSISIGEHTFKATEIWMTPRVDEERENVDISLWHPLFDKIPENIRWTITFLWLDEALGEEGVRKWIGEIKFGNDRLTDAIPLAELPQYVEELRETRGWSNGSPGGEWSSYQRHEPVRGGPLRSDVIAGSTTLFELIRDYPLEEDPVAGFGAEFLMVVIPVTVFGDSPPVDARGEIEEALKGALEQEQEGFSIGGATGLENAYIDLFLTDGSRSRETVRRVLTSLGLWEVVRFAPFVSGP